MIGVVLCGSVSPAQDTDRPFIDGLLQRRLFTLAERFCRDELAKEGVDPQRRAELTAALTRTFSEAASHLPLAQREVVWRKAHGTVAEYLAVHEKDHFAAIVRRQDALVYLTRGELLRFQAETTAQPAALLELARDQLRRATNALESLDQQLDLQLVNLNRQPLDRRPVGVDQVRILRQDVQRQLARALLNQALCFPLDTPDRTSALARATERFKALSLTSDPVDWKSRLGLLQCYRLSGQTKLFNETVARYLTEAPLAVTASLKLEQAEWQLASGQIDAALKMLQNRPATTPTTAAHWDFALLQATLQDRRQGGDAVDDWQQRVSEQIERIRERHGPFWTRRAEALLGRHVTGSADVQEFTLLFRAAEAFYRADQLEEARSTYDRAKSLAEQASDGELAFQAGLAAAAISHQRKQYADAQRRFRQLSLQFTDHPRAAEAHWLAVVNQSQVVKAEPQSESERYLEMLNEHVAKWPSADTADLAMWWLGRYQQARGHWQDAIAAFKKVSNSDSRSVEAVAAIGQCYAKWLDALARKDETEYQRRAVEAVDFFESQRRAADDASLIRQLATVEVARFRIQALQRDFGQAIRQLRELLKQSQQQPHEWIARARLYLVFAFALESSHWEEAAFQLGQADQVALDDLVELVEGLSSLIRDRQGERQEATAGLQLVVLQKIDGYSDQLPQQRQRNLAVAKAEALAAAGRRGDALTQYESLAERFRDDGAIQEGYAQLLVEGSDRDELKRALERWRDVERRSRSGSAAWYRAKYGQALAHHGTGNSKQAIRIIKLTEVLHPGLGSPAMMSKFADLLQRCQSAATKSSGK
ncbi:MAG: hypothetical protein WBF93_09750 [Pirellulales bacterium]